MDTVSIIVPVYNEERYLEQCLDSIVNQTYRNLEIIIINDGSTDGSGRICDKYAQNDSRIKVLHKENEGVPTARNLALDMASGDWVSFVDSDDYLERNMYEVCLNKLAVSDADIIMFENDIIGKDKRKESKEIIIRDEKYLKELQISAIINKKVKGNGFKSPAYIWDKLYRRQFIEEHHIRFPVRVYGQDDIVFNVLCLGYAKSFHYINTSLYHYRVVSNSLSRSYVPNRMEWDEALYKALLQVRDENKFRISESYMEAFYAVIVLNLWRACGRCFFHPDNIKSKKEKLLYVQKILAREPYKKALAVSKYKHLGIGGKLVKLCKIKRAECMYLMWMIKNII